MNSKNARPIRLVHIPKTAGTTVASGLLRKCGRKQRYVFGSSGSSEKEKFDKLDAAKRASIKVFIGHSLFETGVPEADDARLVTYLREPVSRVKSFIRHVAAGKSGYIQPTSRDGKFSVDEFLESGNLELSNLQTKVLINRDRLESNAKIDELGEDKALELATHRLLNETTAFGLNENFDEGWVAIWTALGMKPPLYAILNKRPDEERIVFTDAQVERIKQLNQLDLNLYKTAKIEFERRKSIGIIDPEEIRKFISAQKTWGKLFTQFWLKARRFYHHVYRKFLPRL